MYSLISPRYIELLAYNGPYFNHSGQVHLVSKYNILLGYHVLVGFHKWIRATVICKIMQLLLKLSNGICSDAQITLTIVSFPCVTVYCLFI